MSHLTADIKTSISLQRIGEGLLRSGREYYFVDVPVDADVVGAQQQAQLLHGQLQKVASADEHQEEFHDSRDHELHDRGVSHFSRLQVQ